MIRSYLNQLISMPWWAWLQLGLFVVIGVGLPFLFIHDKNEYIRKLGDYDLNGRIKK